MANSHPLFKAISAEDFDAVKNLVETGKKVNSKDSKGNSPLHLAVTKNNTEIVAFLLRQKKIIVNFRNFFGETPLFLAAKSGKLEIVELLIKHNGNIHTPNSRDVTPLHVSVPYPSLTKLFLEKGAQVEAKDVNGETPLHYAVVNNNLESICMLLYYNADANAVSKTSQTPFFKAIQHQHEGLVEILLDYIADFSDYLDTFLSLVIVFETRCDYIEAIIEKGAKVNSQCFNSSLECGNPEIFKLILDKVPVQALEGNISFYKFIDMVPTSKISEYLEVLIESPKMTMLVGSVVRNMFYLIEKLSQMISEELMIKLLLALIMYGYQLSQIDIHSMFYCYGYSDLLRTLLYIDYDGSFNCITLTPRLIYEVTTTVDTITRDCLSFRRGWIRLEQFKKDLECFFEYCCVPALVKFYQSQNFEDKDYTLWMLPTVPSLVELARNKTREHIVATKRYTKASQYYTYINSIPISRVYKQILMFQKKLYGVEYRMSRFSLLKYE